MDHVASTVVQLGSRGTAHVRHTRRSGKVLAEHVAYAVAPPPAWALTAGPVAAAVVPGAGAAAAAAAPAADPTKGLTFNMHQTDQSQRARQVGRPALVGITRGSTRAGGSGGLQEMTLPYEKAVAGKISYEPDAGDFVCVRLLMRTGLAEFLLQSPPPCLFFCSGRRGPGRRPGLVAVRVVRATRSNI